MKIFKKITILMLIVFVVFEFGIFIFCTNSQQNDAEKLFRLWATADCHVGTDLRREGRESLAEAIRQSEGYNGDRAPSFEWDVALHLGDFSGNTCPPNDEEGREVIRQFSVLKKHQREHFYCIAGNHDASGPEEPCQWWFKKWIDPIGENSEFSGVDSEQRPYTIEGTWERYSFRVGNVLFLMMSDRNDGGPPIGRGSKGGYPAGAVSGETFIWWKKMVEQNQDCIIISAHHHMLKETTVASGPWEGFKKNEKGEWDHAYHRPCWDGGPEGASYLYFVDGKPDAQVFEDYLATHPGAIDFWLGGHTHTNPDDTTGGRSHIETKWGTTFINVCALTRNRNSTTSREFAPIPMSRLLTFTPGNKLVKIQCYLHTDDHASRGWYDAKERTIYLRKAFHW